MLCQQFWLLSFAMEHRNHTATTPSSRSQCSISLGANASGLPLEAFGAPGSRIDGTAAGSQGLPLASRWPRPPGFTAMFSKLICRPQCLVQRSCFSTDKYGSAPRRGSSAFRTYKWLVASACMERVVVTTEALSNRMTAPHRLAHASTAEEGPEEEVRVRRRDLGANGLQISRPV